MSKDWLDSEEFKKCVNRLHGFALDNRIAELPLCILQINIRKHFVPKPQWIKITEDPTTWPPDDAPILICVCNIIYVATRDAKIPELTLDCCCFVVRNADAWMPLPEPWKEEE